MTPPLSSDDENALFERWGWRRDLIARAWFSPDGYAQVTVDELVEYCTSPTGEERLRTYVIRHGERQSSHDD